MNSTVRVRTFFDVALVTLSLVVASEQSPAPLGTAQG